MKEIKGDLIQLALAGEFQNITHGANCFCTMGSGIAPQIKSAFPGAYSVDCLTKKGDYNKLGNYTFANCIIGNDLNKTVRVINSYTQYSYGRDKMHLDYNALILALRKINFNFKGETIGLPLIGAGRGGGDWVKIKNIILYELRDMDVTIVHYDKPDIL